MSGCVHTRIASFMTLVLCALIVFPVAAQEEPQSKRDGGSGVVVVGPDVFVFRDADGNERKLLNMNHADVRAWLERQAGNRQEPEFSLDRFQAVGDAQSDSAKIDVQVDVTLLTDGWARIPLRLDGAIVLEMPTYVGDGEARVVRNADQELELWLRGDRDAKHSIQMKIEALLVPSGNKRQLRLFVPRATRSELVMAIPDLRGKPEVTDGVRVEVLGKIASGGRRVRFRGLGGEVAIAWRNGGADVIAEPLALDVEGRQLVEVHDWHIRAQADLTVSSRGRPFDAFDVVLPVGFQLIEARHGRYRVAKQEGAENKTGAQRVHVTLDLPTTGPIEVRIAAERSYEVDPSGSQVSLSGFDVVGAVRQGGHIALLVDEGRRLSLVAQDRVGRVDVLPDELTSEQVDAGFEYFRQPYQLEVNITPPVASVSVEPQYTFDVSSDQVRLQGQLNYRVSGSNVHELAIDLAGWEVDFESGVTVSRARVDEATQDADGQLKIPLLAGVKGDFEVEFTATRVVPADVSLLRFPLPRVKSELRGATTVIVLSADNVQLSPRRDELVGLTPLRLPPVVSLPERQQKPFYYGTEEGQAEFVSGFQLREQAIDVEVDSFINLAEGTVEQAFVYDVAFEPMESVNLRVPRRLLKDGRFKVQLEGEPLELVELSVPSIDEQTVLVGTLLSEPLIGRFRIRVLGTLPDFTAEGPVGNQPGEVEVALAMPAVDVLARNELRVEGGDSLEFDLLSEAWSEIEADTGTVNDEIDLQVRAKTAQSLVRFSLERIERSADTRVLVRRGWVRTWLAPDGRRDRAVYRLRGRDDLLNIALPEGVDVGSLQVRVDGKEQVATLAETGGEGRPSLQVIVPGKLNEDYLLELQYSFHEVPRRSPVSIQTPRFGNGDHRDVKAGEGQPGNGASVEDVIYYELLTPESEYLLGPPREMTPVWNWSWQKTRWARVPLMSADEIGEWSGESMKASLHATGWTRYLFSSMSAGKEYRARFINRATATFVGAGGVLAIGLALLYLPTLRRPGMLLVVAVVLLTAGLIYPEPTLMLAQTGALGLLLVLLATVLRYALKVRPVSANDVLLATGSSARLRTTEFHIAAPGQRVSSQRTSLASPTMSSFTQQEPAPSEP